MVEASTVAMFSTDAGAYGGAFAVIGLRLQRSSMSISTPLHFEAPEVLQMVQCLFQNSLLWW